MWSKMYQEKVNRDYDKYYSWLNSRQKYLSLFWTFTKKIKDNNEKISGDVKENKLQF